MQSARRLLVRVAVPVTTAVLMAACSNTSSPNAPSAFASTELAATAQKGGGKGGGQPGPLSMAASKWTFQFSPGMPVSPSPAAEGWEFVFPNANGVHYLTTSQPTSMPAQSIAASFEIVTTGSPLFEYRTEPFNTCDVPATVRLFFQRRGDNLSGTHKFASYRWWNNPVSYVLAPGSTTLVGDLTDLSQWTNVDGEPASAHAAEFEAAMSNEANVGFTFGGGCFFGHGVYVTPGTGQAIFHATQFVVQ
jgi:hypothetical protein